MLLGTGRYVQLDKDMNEIPAEISVTTDVIEAAFSGRWGIWLSDTGYWWASYRGTLTLAETGAGRVPFLRADSAEKLRELVQTQEELPVHAAPEATGAASREDR